MSVVLLAHLSDAHLRTVADPLMKRASALARAIAGEIDGSVKGCVLAFTGDATDKGFVPGFGVAKQFLGNLANEIEKLTSLRPVMLSVPGNHDVVIPPDSDLRDLAINSLTGDAATARPKKALEEAILAPLSDYFAFADTVAPGASPNKDKPNPVRHGICATAFSYESMNFLPIALAPGMAFAHI
jgi:predicted MPP superfamily phosphohydrolase